jgi:hypothetical protein
MTRYVAVKKNLAQSPTKCLYIAVYHTQLEVCHLLVLGLFNGAVSTSQFVHNFSYVTIEIYLFEIRPYSRPDLESTQPPTHWVPGALYPEVKQQRREADRSPTTSAELKNDGAIPTLPHTSSWFSP